MPGGRSLIAYRNALEAVRVARQEAWDAQFGALKRREAALFQLYADIGAGIEAPFATIGDRISGARAAAYDGEIERVGAVKAARGAVIDGLAAEVAGLWEELGFGPCDEYDRALAGGAAGRASLGWGTAVIDTLRGKVAALTAEKAAREEKIMVMGQRITTLWKRLSTSEEEQTAFLEAHAGIGDDVIQAVRGFTPPPISSYRQCETYLAKKTAEFEVRLVELITAARTGLETMWCELRWPASVRAAAFPGAFAPPGAFTDALFLEHEAYAASLSATLAEARPILKNIEKRGALLEDKAEYEALLADPARLIKGSSSARLREEKLERRVKKELPAFNKRLREQVVAFEAARGGAPFHIDGARFVDILDAEEAAEARARGEARATRRGGAGGGEGGEGEGAEAPAPRAPAAPAAGAAAPPPRAPLQQHHRAASEGSGALGPSAAANAARARPAAPSAPPAAAKPAPRAPPAGPPPAPTAAATVSAAALSNAEAILQAL
jgi:hypothetical protein